MRLKFLVWSVFVFVSGIVRADDPEVFPYRYWYWLADGQAVAVSGDYVYVADEYKRFRVAYFPTQTYPIVATIDVPSFGPLISKMTSEGTSVYAACATNGLQIINVSNPAAPVYRGGIVTPGKASDVVIIGNFAFAADGTFGVQVINIVDAAHPQIVGNFDTPGAAKGLFLDGHYMFVADGIGLSILDVANPQQPILVGSYSDTAGGDIRQIRVRAGYAYLAVGPTTAGAEVGGLEVVDVSEPSSPKRVGSPLTSLKPSSRIELMGNFAIVGGSYGTSVIDISNPESPRVGASFGVPNMDLAVVGNHLFEMARSSALYVKEIRPSPLNSVGSFPLALTDVDMHGTFGYGVFRDGKIRSFDASNPSAPKILSTFPTSSATRVKGNSNVLAVVAANSPIFFDPANPNGLQGQLANWKYATDVAVNGTFAYVARTSGSGALTVVDVSNTSAPKIVDEFIGDFITKEVVANERIVVAYETDPVSEATRTRIFDATDPGRLRQVSVTGTQAHLSLVGNYLTDGYGLIDVSDPTKPTYVPGGVTLPEFSGDGRIVIANGYLYRDFPFRIEVGDPRNPNGGLIANNYSLHGPIFRIGDQIIDGTAILPLFPQVTLKAEKDLIRIKGPTRISGRIESSSDLQNWNNLLPISFDDSDIEIQRPQNSEPAFYRVKIE